MMRSGLWAKIIGTLLLLECSLQVVALTRYTWVMWQKRQTENDMVSRTWALRDPLFREIYTEEDKVYEEYQPFIGWKTREMQTAHIHVDADGVRKTVGNPDTSAGTASVFFFGGSTMWGEGLSDEQTIPSRIASTANAHEPVLHATNYGEIGYGSTQELVRLMLLLKSGIIPDYVVMYDGCNDFFLATLDTRPHETFRDVRMRERLGNIWELPEDGKRAAGTVNTSVISREFWEKVWRGISTYVQLVHVPLELYRMAHQGRAVQAPNQGVSAQDTGRYADTIAQTYIENAQVLDALSRMYQFEYLLVWQPTIYSRNMTDLEKQLPDIHPDQYPQLSIIYEQAAARIKASGIKHFTDLSRVFEDTSDTVYTDTCHVTSAANTLLSLSLYTSMREEFGL